MIISWFHHKRGRKTEMPEGVLAVAALQPTGMLKAFQGANRFNTKYFMQRDAMAGLLPIKFEVCGSLSTWMIRSSLLALA